jgi:phage gpG-like protein
VTGPTFVWDDSKAQALFARLSAAGRSVGPLLDTVVHAITERVRLAFHDQADPWGEPWTPLARVTLNQRRDGGGGGVSILRDTGQLLASLVGAVTRGLADIRIGFADRPATIHQFGGTIKRTLAAGSVRLRTDAKGNLLRQEGHDRLAVFAKRKHKRFVERQFEGRDYEFTVPARPMLPIRRDGSVDMPQSWRDELVAAMTAHVEAAIA